MLLMLLHVVKEAAAAAAPLSSSAKNTVWALHTTQLAFKATHIVLTWLLL
jgi:hypothetical protein